MPDADETETHPKPDLRYTSRVDQSVSIDRDMSGAGHLARGSNSRMSNIRFSVQAKARNYQDPELAALHDNSSVVEQSRFEVPDATPPAIDAPAPTVVPPTVFSRITGVIRRFAAGR